jgi:hypothetical protein
VDDQAPYLQIPHVASSRTTCDRGLPNRERLARAVRRGEGSDRAKRYNGAETRSRYRYEPDNGARMEPSKRN